MDILLNSTSQWIKDFGIWHKLDAKGRDVYVVKINRQRKSARKEFIVERYPSKKAAEIAALAYRDRMLREVLPMTKRECTSILRKNNTSGVPGVGFQKSTNVGGLGYWVAYIQRPGHPMERKSFSVKKFGAGKAFEMAVVARQEMLKETSGWMSKHPHGTPPPDTLEPLVPPLASLSFSRRLDSATDSGWQAQKELPQAHSPRLRALGSAVQLCSKTQSG